VADWREQKEILCDKLGFWGYVVVQATAHGADNRVVIDALEKMQGRAAGVATVTEDVHDDELRRMHEAGVRGVRFAFLPHIASETTPPEVIERIAQRIQPLGWHVDLYFLPQNFDVMGPLIRRLPTPVLIDHMGRPDVKVPVESNDYFQRLLELGAARNDIYWKLTSPDRYTGSAWPEDWAVALPFAHALDRHFPGRVMSGTDRPRPNMNTVIKTPRLDQRTGRMTQMPNDGDIMNHWVWPVAQKDPAALKRILTENPRKLYQFKEA
jgi:2-pyrone-4,6-dicarboxylate lactonase